MVVVAIEAIAGAKIVHVWLPKFEVWQIGLALMAVLTAVNLTSARSYGEFEFWFASIKVAAIIVFIVVAAAWLFGVGNPASPGFSNLTAQGGFAPFGWSAIFAGITTVIFSMWARRSSRLPPPNRRSPTRPCRAWPRRVVLRILLFYVLVDLADRLRRAVERSSSPAIPRSRMALERIGIPGAASIMNMHRADGGAVVPQLRCVRHRARAVRHGRQG